MTDVSLRLFGAPRLDIDGRPTQLGRRKATALLSYLAVTRSRHHRESLAALLWPESGPEAAYSALRNVLWILRQTPLARLLRTDRSTIELVEDESLWVDVHRFRDLTGACPRGRHAGTAACPECAPALDEAARLVEAPFMDGFIVGNAEGFDDWQFAEREALAQELTETLDRLTAFSTDAGEWAAVTAHARRWLQVDRLSEVAYRRLMRGLAGLGRRSEALRCYEECRQTLDKELGLPPEAATTEIAEQIRDANAGPKVCAIGARRTNPPAPVTPFVGREELIARVSALLVEEESRLVTLVGLGGIGKTSLAMQIGRQIGGSMGDGVFFVPLRAADGPEALAPSIADVLGLSHSRDKGSHLALELEDYLRDRDLLLILDEAEESPLIGERVTALLSAAPHLRCLVTSRQPLSVRGEAVVAVHGLPCPDEGSPAEAIGEYDAIRLLKVAERRVDSAGTGRKGELQAMARVARLLEGLPLGLEMAGAWRSVFSWREIADRIASNLDFLVHTRRDVPARHRNLRAVYEQAWGLLSREERTSLCRLAVFQGGFGMDAAERVTGSSPAVLAALAQRCLIRRIDAERYQLHELLRQFSLENLRAASGDYESAVERHAAFFVGFVEESFAALKGREQLEALHRLQSDLANVRAGWLSAASAGRTDLLRRAAHGLFFYFDMRALFDEGAWTFHDALERLPAGLDPAVDGFLRVAQGWFTQFSPEVEPQPWIREGLALLDGARPFSADHALANIIACYAEVPETLEEARGRLANSLAHYRDAGDAWGEALATDALACVEFPMDAEAGQKLAAESLRLRRRIGDRWGEALNLATLGQFAESQGEWDLARARYRESQRLGTRIAEDLHLVVEAQLARARLAGRMGELDEGERLAEKGLALARRASSRLLTAHALVELGRLARDRGDPDAARARLEEAYTLLEGTPWRKSAVQCAAMLGDVAEAAGDAAGASRWRGEARAPDPAEKEGR